MDKLTDNQLRILGTSIGQEFAKQLWHEIKQANPRKEMYTIEYLCKTVGEAIGKNMTIFPPDLTPNP